MPGASRPLALLAAGIFLFGVSTYVAGQDVRDSSDFEVKNEAGLKINPPGLRFELRTPDGRHTYHLYETIPIEMVFSSSRPMAYSVELLERANFAGQSYWFEFNPVNGITLAKPDFGMSITCCDSNRPYLSAKPIVLRKELTDILRFEKPGDYGIFVTTRRVFHGNGIPKTPLQRGDL